MNEHKPKTEAELNRDNMEEARRELETQALIRRMNAGNDPMTPVEEPSAEDRVPTHEITPGASPDEVIDEERLGVK